MFREESGKKSTELGHDVINEIRQVLERFERRFRFDDPRFIQRYIESEALILCHFRVEGFDQEYVANLGRTARSNGEREGFVETREGTGKHGRQVNASVCDGPNQELMLVGIVQGVQLPEFVPLPSLVRLGCVNCIYNLLPHMLCYSASCGWVMRGKIADGVIDLPIKLRIASQNKLIGDVVEGTSKILNYVGGDCLQGGRNAVSFADVIDAISSCRIFLGADSIWCGVMKGAQRKIQILDVLFGPCDFRSNAVDGFSHW